MLQVITPERLNCLHCPWDSSCPALLHLLLCIIDGTSDTFTDIDTGLNCGSESKHFNMFTEKNKDALLSQSQFAPDVRNKEKQPQTNPTTDPNIHICLVQLLHLVQLQNYFLSIRPKYACSI